jgi:hypothetical protein
MCYFVAVEGSGLNEHKRIAHQVNIPFDNPVKKEPLDEEDDPLRLESDQFHRDNLGTTDQVCDFKVEIDDDNDTEDVRC